MDSQPNKKAAKMLNLNDFKKDKVLDGLPNNLAKHLKSFGYDDRIILKDFIESDIEVNNRTSSVEFNFVIDINRDETSIITLLKELNYNLEQRNKTVYQFQDVVREHISTFFSDFTSKNESQPSITQIEFEEESARNRFAFSERAVYSFKKNMTSHSIVSMAQPTGNKTKDESNKAIVIHSLFALYGNTVPENLYNHLMSIQQPNFYDVASQLARVLNEFSTFVGGTHLYILPMDKMQTRLIHGLKLYEYIFLYKQFDTKIPESSNYMVIFDQLQQSYAEDFQVTSIPFDETEIKKTIKYMEDAYAIF